MNCKRMIAAVAAFVLTGSVSGFAAEVTTTTIYNGDSGKVEVNTAVTGASAESEVTYIVKSNNEVVYIDQDTATDGSVNFTYKITQSKIASDYSTSVKFGSSAEAETFSGTGVENLGIQTLQQSVSDSHYTITYPGGEQAWGIGETVIATVVPDDGYEVTAIYIDGVEQESTTNTVELTYGQVLTADVQATVVAPGLDSIILDVAEITLEGETFKERTVILKPIGELSSIGVYYNGTYYESLGGTDVNSAVRIIFPAEEETYELIPAYQVTENGDIITVE